MSVINVEDVEKDFKDILKKIALDNGLPIYELKIESLNSKGGNYMGNIFTVDIIENDAEKPKDEEKTLHLFVKITNVPESAREVIQAGIVYQREEFAYTTLREMFKDLQDKYDVPDEERFKFARIYGSQTKVYPEIIVLENLAKKGYTMYDRLMSMDWEFASEGIRELARFHALSFALQRDNPEKYDTSIRSMASWQSETKSEDKVNVEYKDRMEKNVLLSLEDSHREVVKRFLDKLDQDCWRNHYVPGEKPSVLVHGDYRISNIMVKYEEGRLTSLYALDFQTIFCGSPFNDFLYFIFTGTDSAFRSEHFDECLQLYYASLKKSLALLSQDISQVYPYEQFMVDLKEKLTLSLLIGIYFLPMIMVDPDAAPNLMDLVDGKGDSQLSNALYTDRINGIVEDLLRWGGPAVVGGSAVVRGFALVAVLTV